MRYLIKKAFWENRKKNVFNEKIRDLSISILSNSVEKHFSSRIVVYIERHSFRAWSFSVSESETRRRLTNNKNSTFFVVNHIEFVHWSEKNLNVFYCKKRSDFVWLKENSIFDIFEPKKVKRSQSTESSIIITKKSCQTGYSRANLLEQSVQAKNVANHNWISLTAII